MRNRIFSRALLPKNEVAGVGYRALATSRREGHSQGNQSPPGKHLRGEFPDGFFDVVSVIDTFYYFMKPQLELAEFRRVLKPDGMLVLELPLGASRVWRTSNQLGKLLSGVRRHLIESSDHLFYYNPKSIKFFLEKYGFNVQTVLPLPGNRQQRFVRNLIYRVYSLVSLGLHSVSRSNLFLGPRFLVVAHKS
jgi:SAM-dependent methyltransferase